MNDSSKVLVNNNKQTKKMLKIILRIIGYMKPYFLLALLGMLLLFANVFFNIKTALIIKELTDVIAVKDMNKLSSLLAFYIPYSLFFILLMCVGNFVRNYVQNLVGKSLCVDLFNRINNLPYRFIQGNHTGDLVARVNKDVELAVGLIGNNVYSLIENSLVCVLAFIYLTSVNAALAFLVLITGPITFMVGRIFDSKIRNISKDVQDKGGEVRGVLQEFLQGMPVVRAFNMEEDFHNRFISTRNDQITIMKRNTLLNIIMWRIVIFTNVTVTLLIVYFVSWYTINGHLSIGSALAFIFLMGRVQWPFINISKNWGTVQQSYGAAQRIFDILNIEPEGNILAKTTDSTSTSSTALSFNAVNFSYKSTDGDDKEKQLYNNLNLEIKPGELVALVGPSGSGKTTLARLCCGLYIPDAGDITIFDKSILSDLRAARNNISYVPQSPYLFAGTVKENIAFGKETATEDDIIAAAKAANAHEFILNLEKGYDTIIGEKGISLSGGQRQRIAIARAFIKKSPFIVLDEATSALDNESEYLVQQSMDRLMDDRTVLVIAHRLSTVRNADRILVMDKGSIVEEGSHEDLLQLNGLYSELYKLQFAEA